MFVTLLLHDIVGAFVNVTTSVTIAELRVRL